MPSMIFMAKKINCPNINIYFIRANKTKYKGAENYLFCLSKALIKQNIKHQVVNSIFPKFMLSWLRVILFNLQVC